MKMIEKSKPFARILSFLIHSQTILIVKPNYIYCHFVTEWRRLLQNAYVFVAKIYFHGLVDGEINNEANFCPSEVNRGGVELG